MLKAILPYLWCLFFLVSASGWGRAVLAGFEKTGKPLDIPSTLVGISFLVFLGGWLNFFELAGMASIRGLFFLGLIAFCFFLLRDRKAIRDRALELGRQGKSLSGLFSSVLAMAGAAAVLVRMFFFLGRAFLGYNGHEDMQAYLVLPARLLQTGSLGADPFNAHRLISGLGGAHFLQAFPLAFLPELNMICMDQGIGFVLLIVGVDFLARRMTLPLAMRGVLALTLSYFFLPVCFNINSGYIGGAFYGGTLALVAVSTRARPRLDAVILGLFMGAACAQKGVFIGPCALLMALYFGLIVFQEEMTWMAKLWIVALFASVFVAMLLPWSLSLYKSNGTALFPLLGKGFHGSVYGIVQMPEILLTISKLKSSVSSVWNWVPAFHSLFVAAIALCLFRSGRDQRALVVVTLSALGSLLVMELKLGHNIHLERYASSFLLCATLFPGLSIFRFLKGAIGSARASMILCLVCPLVVAPYQKEQGRELALQETKEYLRAADLYGDSFRKEVRDLQNSIPKGVSFLARIETPALFDFRRNPIYVASLPGVSSPPPGMPLFKGGELLKKYLLDVGVRYVAYDFNGEANYSRKEFQPASGAVTDWTVSEARAVLDFQDSVAELGKICKQVFNNGNAYVLDLTENQAPASSDPAAEK